MEDFGAVWTFQENVDDLRRKLEYVTYELEITRKVTNEEIMKNNVNIKKLLQLLQITCKERDDAKSNLKKLQQFLTFTNNNKPLNVEPFIVTTPTFSPDSPLLNNNNVVSDANNIFSQQCHVSSPILDSLPYNNLTTDLSPESSNICFSGSTSPILMANAAQTTKPVDRATLMIESLAKGKPRPTQGKLLQAVLQAGPLLETLIIAGSLPQWRNPPGQMATQVHPMQRRECDIQLDKGLGNLPFYGQISGGSLGTSPNYSVEFGTVLSGKIMSNAVSFNCHQAPKRQRTI